MSAEDMGRKFPTPDVEFGLSGQLGTDQGPYIEIHRAPRAETFVRLEANVDVASVGQDIIIKWYKNGTEVVAAQVTITAGQTYGFTVCTINLLTGDTLRPQIAQVGLSTVGSTITMAARGR